MNNLKSYQKNILIVCFSVCMVVSQFLSMKVERAVRPAIESVSGYIYQIIARFFNSLDANSLTMALLFMACFWFFKKFLFKKQKNTGIGEYILCAFFTVCMLVSAAMRASGPNGGTISILWENAFQLNKVIVYCLGYFPLFLCLLRGLQLLLNKASSYPSIKPNSFWDKHPFLFPFLVLVLVWGMQIIFKYPGVIHLDVTVPILRYENAIPKISDFSPMEILIYGITHVFSSSNGCMNEVWFIFLLFQAIGFMLVISYCLSTLQKQGVPKIVLTIILAVFCISPVFIGWIVTIGKDARYMVFALLLSILFLTLLLQPHIFVKKASLVFLLLFTYVMLIFTRSNGQVLVLITLPFLLYYFIKYQKSWLLRGGLVLLSVFVFWFPYATNEYIIQKLDIQKITFYDYLSVPFQQTARVARIHGDTLTEEEKQSVNTLLDASKIGEVYNPGFVDPVKSSKTREAIGQSGPIPYLSVWLSQGLRYPITYIDAFVNLNYKLFDLQSNYNTYHFYTDIKLHTHPYAFHHTEFFDLEQIRPLLDEQYALTQWYYDFEQIPVIGLLATMSFNNIFLLMILYLSYVNKKKYVVIMALPILFSLIMTAFCPIVYMRYLLPVVVNVPLCLGAYFTKPSKFYENNIDINCV